ncbi:cold shock domain-containing protein [Bradyrhizobium sp. CB1717]|uniref:cold-shock protein n=1 Tax=Bradyrhizobium sp. CB1717 TaxID=3039154 RepID=UPI0024B2188C|nr:cold shock domain-containing protein [Bradyrhizobium sp. CB1717]WFU21916.1 cold shock domain-containing protein [Bradyrhizobium sp. CB1717]
MKVGRIISWNSERGFGWIRNSEGGPDLFAHISEFPPQIDPIVGTNVRFEIKFDDRRGKSKAVGVSVI